MLCNLTFEAEAIQVTFKNLITEINWLLQFRKITAVYSDNHKKPINTLSEQSAESTILKSCDPLCLRS
jgi:hypothetical protein